jgi:biotin carboxylase
MLMLVGMADSAKKLLVVMPTMWDLRQFDACRAEWQGRIEPEYGTPADADCSAWFDALSYIDQTSTRRDFDGVFSSSDYPGAVVAAAVANSRKLPGPDVAAVLRAGHKYASRKLQQAAVPEACPRFDLVNPDDLKAPATGFPCFVKPVKGSYTVFARRVDSMAELRAHLAQDGVKEFRRAFMDIFNKLWARYIGDGIDGRYFIAEELLSGTQVTVEGFVQDGEAEVIGVVDSEFYPGTSSFSRFVCPSALPGQVQGVMVDLARKCVAALGLRHTFFNIEMFWDGKRASIIEVNPRICGQFGDLYAKVDGRNACTAAAELACGLPIKWPRGQGGFSVAASVPLRVFKPCRVTNCPNATRIAEIEARYPRTLIWSDVEPEQVIDDFAFEDGGSSRYAVFNLGADSRVDLDAKQREITAALGYKFAPL